MANANVVHKYIGRRTDFLGKTLWEIVGSLKDFGVGRYVYRHMFTRYPEPSFMKIVKVQVLPNEEIRKVKVTVEKTFRGHKSPKLVEIMSTSYKADYRLIPKHMEAEMCNSVTAPEEKILPKHIQFPPLLREFIARETGNSNPMLPLKHRPYRETRARIANDGETPNMEINIGLGTTISPSLYKDCDF